MTDKQPWPAKLQVYGLSWKEPASHLAKLPALATRLGVEPVKPDHPPTMLLSMGHPDNRDYDLFELINAVLDRLDADPKLRQAHEASAEQTKEIG